MAISLNDHERRIKDFEGQVNTINSKITSLENRPPAKDWAIVDIRTNSHRGAVRDFVIPSQYINYNWCFLSLTMWNFSFYATGVSGSRTKVITYENRDHSMRGSKINNIIRVTGKCDTRNHEDPSVADVLKFMFYK